MSLEWETRVTGVEEQTCLMDSLETKEEEEEDNQGVDKTAMELYEQTDIIDEQVGWGVVEIITGA